MASWFDLKGTFQDKFRIGKNKTRLDASAPTVSRDFILPDASVDLSGGTINQVLTKLTATSIGWANAGGGGGGGYTEIANNGTISGSYDGNVHCLGNVTITGNLTVKGSIYVVGKTTNLVGASVTVYGDCTFAGEVDFQTNTGVAAGNIDIKGNFYTGERSTPYPLRNVISGGITILGASPVNVNSNYAVVSDSYLEIQGYDYSTILTIGDYILVNGGVNAGFSRQVVSLFWDGSNTQVTTTAFPNVFAGDESNFTLKPNNAFLAPSTLSAYIPTSIYVLNGVNAAQTISISLENASPDGFGFIEHTSAFTSPVDYFDFAVQANTVFQTDYLYKHLSYKNNCPSDFPSGTKLKFTSASNNSNYVFGVNIIDNSNDINLSTPAPLQILLSDKFFTLDDMGMLFTWDVGPAPTISIGMNYYSVGGLLAEGRSGNLNGANINIKGNVIAENSNSSLPNYEVYNGAKISCNGFGSGNGGNINIFGKVINCSLSSFASQLDSVILSGNGGNISIGSFDGKLTIKKETNFGIAAAYGNSVLNYGGYISNGTINAIAGNGGSFICRGSFTGVAMMNRGGIFATTFVTSTGGNAGLVKIMGNVLCATFNCAAGGSILNGSTKTGILNTIYISGNLTSNTINISGGSDEYGGMSENNPSYDASIDMEFLGSLIGLDLQDVNDNTILASLNNNSPLNSSSRPLFLSELGDIENFRYSSSNLAGISMVVIGTAASSAIRCRNINKSIIYNVRINSPSLAAGTITVFGNVFLSTLSSICIDGSGFSIGGNGGSITISGNVSLSTLSVRGNEVYSTTGTTTTNAGNGGSITIQGTCYNSTLAANGGRIRHNVASTATSGAGGTITINGNVLIGRSVVTAFTVAGGNRETGAAAGVAGAGGTIDIQGTVNILATIAGGGGDNVAGSTGGSCGQLRFGSGGTTANIEWRDGAGLVPTTARNIVFNGSCNFRKWDIPSRSTVKIRSRTTLAAAVDNTATSAYIYCPDRQGKLQLTKSSGAETVNLLSSHWITFFNGTDWYTVAYTGPV